MGCIITRNRSPNSVMSEFEVIESTLERAGQRCRLSRALRGLWRGLLIGASISLLLAAVYHLAPLPVWVVSIAALVSFPCMAGGICYWRLAQADASGRGALAGWAAAFAGAPQHRSGSRAASRSRHLARPGRYRRGRTRQRTRPAATVAACICPKPPAGHWSCWPSSPAWDLCPNTAARAISRRKRTSGTSRKPAGSWRS